MWTRRTFLRLSGGIGATALAGGGETLRTISAASAAVSGEPPDRVARDESYWRHVQRAFDVDRTLINLNNGNSSPCPRVVHDAFKHHLDVSNRLPAYYRGLIEQNIPQVRQQLATEFGCDADELAIMRNATEALHVAQCGLDLTPGDEVVTTDQDYSLMLWAWNQRAVRDGLSIRRIQFPVPATGADLLERFTRALTPRTKVLHFCHMSNTTGQLFPVRDLCRLAAERGIFTIVDGAQATAHVPVNLHDLGCDVYGASLHKWLMAPHGTGFLYVRRDRIAEIWPLHAERDIPNTNIWKFEEIGTHPAAAVAAIPDAVAFHRAIGTQRKAARLRYLTLRWAEALKSEPRIKMLSSLEPGETWGMATMEIAGVNAQRLAQYLLDARRIVVAAEVDQKFPGPIFEHQGIRVTPNVYSTLGEIDTFVRAIKAVLEHGLPPA